MASIFYISLRKNSKDLFLLFWSIFMPLLILIGLVYFQKETHFQILGGLLTISMFFFCCTTNAFSIFAQRSRGVFDLLSITPLPMRQYLMSVTASLTVISVTIASGLLLIENFLFDLALTGQTFVSFLLLFTLGSVVFSLLGFILSSIPKQINQLSILANLVMIPLVLGSSIFFNLSQFPLFIRLISWLNPFEWLQKAYSAVQLGATGDYLMAVLALLIMAGVLLFFAVRSFRGEKA